MLDKMYLPLKKFPPLPSVSTILRRDTGFGQETIDQATGVECCQNFVALYPQLQLFPYHDDKSAAHASYTFRCLRFRDSCQRYAARVPPHVALCLTGLAFSSSLTCDVPIGNVSSSEHFLCPLFVRK
jgi:hypothetical protein